MRYSIKKSLLGNKIIILIYILALLLIPSKQLYSELLDNWTDERAYKPVPILFLHGFGPGSPQRWDYIAGNLSQYYSPYQQIGPFIGNSGSQYLERIHFIDANGSVDGPGGWTDQLDHTINNLLDSDKYGDYSNKLILVAHSMGGLAARNYIMNVGERNVLKLITINTPHAGSPLANCSKNLVKSRTIALFIPVIGWGYAGSITTVRAQVVDLNSIDLSGEAIRDLSIGGPFLTQLASRGSPSSENFIYGISSYTENILNQWFFWPYYPNSRTALIPKYAGDSIVPIDSQEGWDVYTDEGKRNPIEVWHMDETKRLYGPEHSSILQNSEVRQQILKWIDLEPPEVEITGVKILENGVEQDVPLTGGVYQIARSSCILEGSVKKEFFPANSTLNITIQREGGASQQIVNAAVLKPDDSWDPNNPDSVVAGFKETINFPRPGTYEVTIKVINPAGRESNQEVITIEAVFSQPIIEPVNPTDGEKIGERRPTIQARIYTSSDDGIEGPNINLESIVMELDGIVVNHAVNPPEGGAKVLISYIPGGDLDIGFHTVTINAADINGTNAEEVSWEFEVCKQIVIYTTGFTQMSKWGDTYAEARAGIPSMQDGDSLGQEFHWGWFRIKRLYIPFYIAIPEEFNIISIKLCLEAMLADAVPSDFFYYPPNVRCYSGDWGDDLTPSDWGSFRNLVGEISSDLLADGHIRTIILEVPRACINSNGTIEFEFLSDRDEEGFSPLPPWIPEEEEEEEGIWELVGIFRNIKIEIFYREE